MKALDDEWLAIVSDMIGMGSNELQDYLNKLIADGYSAKQIEDILTALAKERGYTVIFSIQTDGKDN